MGTVYLQNALFRIQLGLSNHVEDFVNSPLEQFDQLVCPMETRMIQSIWRVTQNHADAEDALQNALVQIWKQLDRVITHPNPNALVLKISLDAACDVVRRRKRHSCSSVSDENALKNATENSTNAAPESAFNAAENSRLVVEALRQLPRRQALAVTMRSCDQSYDDIADVMDCSLAAARKHVSLGRQKLKAELSKWFDLHWVNPSNRSSKISADGALSKSTSTKENR